MITMRNVQTSFYTRKARILSVSSYKILFKKVDAIYFRKTNHQHVACNISDGFFYLLENYFNVSGLS